MFWRTLSFQWACLGRNKIDEARTKSSHDIFNKRKVAHTTWIRFKLTLDHQRVPKVFKKFLGTILNGSFKVLKDMVVSVTKKIDEARTKSPHDILNKRKVAHTMRIRCKLTLDHQRVPKVFKKFLGTILNGSFKVLKVHVVSVTKKIDEARTKSPHDILNKRKVAHTTWIRCKLTLDHQRVPKVFKKFLGTILNFS